MAMFDVKIKTSLNHCQCDCVMCEELLLVLQVIDETKKEYDVVTVLV